MILIVLKSIWKEFGKQADLHGKRLNFPFLIFAAIVSIFGAGVSAIGQVKAGKAQARMSAYNAQIARQNAELSARQADLQKRQTGVTEARHREAGERTKAAQRTALAKGGVETGSGTSLLIAEETAQDIELDALAIRFAGNAEQAELIARKSGFEQQALISKMRGKAARSAGKLGAGATLLTGLSSATGFASQIKKPVTN